MRKVELLPTWDCEAGYAPDDGSIVWSTNRSPLPMKLFDSFWLPVTVPVEDRGLRNAVQYGRVCKH